MTPSKLPIGIQTFRKIREDGCYYVDKTAYVLSLLEGGARYFLSRPRRFGKSLFLDTLKELFEGSQELFEGLHIHDRWDWSTRHPVLRLSFASGNFHGRGGLDASLMAQLDRVQRDAGVESRYPTAPERFGHVIEQLHRRYGQPVAVLVDEYDKPILDVIEKPEAARANRDYLRGVYSVIKDRDAHIRFAFLTGVSKFSKSQTTRATMRASSTPISRRWGWTSPWRTAAAGAAWTWRCASTPTSTCSSSRWLNCRPWARRWPN